MARNPTRIDMTDRRFGRWLVIRQDGNTRGGGAMWLSRCDCGTERRVLGADLRSGATTSCGCFSNEMKALRSYKHGGSGSRLYHIWKSIRARCGNVSNPNYGGRGITVHVAWNEFAQFAEWAKQSGYQDKLILERLDDDGNFTPENCAWADAETQPKNRRFARTMPDGRPALPVAKENGISSRAFRTRVANGWSIELAATWPSGKPRFPREK